MTAEQFYLKWANESFGLYPDRKPAEYSIHFAESYANHRLNEEAVRLESSLKLVRAEAAAQLAEKEREIINLKSDAFEADLELTAAEQRLQEAQATNRELNRRNQSLQKSLNAESGRKSWHGYFAAALQLFAKRDDECADLRDRLRQREAELEQRWIAVGKKEPPKDGREVLLMVKYRAGIPNGKLVGHWQPGGHCIQDHPPIEAGWYFWNGTMFDQASEPTHWQALPSPPKEAK